MQAFLPSRPPRTLHPLLLFIPIIAVLLGSLPSQAALAAAPQANGARTQGFMTAGEQAIHRVGYLIQGQNAHVEGPHQIFNPKQRAFAPQMDDPIAIYLDPSFGPSTPGWGYSHFSLPQAAADMAAEVASRGGSAPIHMAAGVYFGGLTLANGVILLLEGDATLPGNLTQTAGEIHLGDHSLSLGGNFTFSGGIFDPGSGTLRFIATGDQTLSGLPIDLYNLEVASGARLNLLAHLSLAGDLTVNGELNGPTAHLTLSGASLQTLSGAGSATLLALTIENSGPAGDQIVGGNLALSVRGALVIEQGRFAPSGCVSAKDWTIQAGASFAPQGDCISVAGDWINHGTFDPGLSTITFNGNGPQAIGGSQANSFYNLAIHNTAVLAFDEIDVDPTGAITVLERLTITAGQFQPHTGSTFKHVSVLSEGILRPDPGAVIRVSGDWQQGDGGWFDDNGGRVIFNGESAQAILGSPNFFELEIDNGGGLNDDTDVDPGAAISVDESLLITRGQFQPHHNSRFGDVQIAEAGRLKPDGNIYVGGNFKNATPGGYIHNNRAVIFDGGKSDLMLLEGQADFHSLFIYSGKTLRLAKDANLGFVGMLVIYGALDATSQAPTTLTLLGEGQTLPEQALDLHHLVIAPGASLEAPGDGEGVLRLGGDLRADGVFNANGGSVELTGPGDHTITGNPILHNLTVKGGGTLTLPEHGSLILTGILDTGGAQGLDALTNEDTTLALFGTGERSLPSGLELRHLTLGSGVTLNAPALLYIGGNLNAQGSINPGTGEIIFNGTGFQSVSGWPSFYNLTLDSSLEEGTALRFDGTVTIANLLKVLDGQLVTGLAHLKDVAISPYGALAPAGALHVSGQWDNDGNFVHGGQEVRFVGAGEQVISGDQATAFGDLVIQNTSAGQEVRADSIVNVAGQLQILDGRFHPTQCGDYASVEIDSQGVFAPTGCVNLSGDWINDGVFTHNDVTVTVNGLSTISGSNPTTFAGLSLLGGSLTLRDETKIGSLTTSGGVLQAASGADIRLLGDWDYTGGHFEPGTSLFHFEGTGPQRVNGESVQFYGLRLNNPGGLIFASPPTISALTIEAGQLDLPANTQLGSVTVSGGVLNPAPGGGLFVSGNWQVEGGFNHNGGTVTFNGSALQQMNSSGTTVFNELVVTNSSSGVSATQHVTASRLQVNGRLTLAGGADLVDVQISGTGRLTASGGTAIAVSGNWTTSTGGLFTPGTSTVTFDGAGAQAISGATSFYNLTINASGPVSASAQLTASNQLTLSSGSLTLANGADLRHVTICATCSLNQTGGTLYVSGNWLNHGAFNPAEDSTVNFDGTSAQSMGGNSVLSFENLTVTYAGVVTPASPLFVEDTLTVLGGELIVPAGSVLNEVNIGASGTLRFVNGTVTVDGTWTNNGTFHQGSASITGSYTLTLVYINPAYQTSTPGYGFDHFSTLGEGMQAAGVEALVNVQGIFNDTLTVNKDVQVNLANGVQLGGLDLQAGEVNAPAGTLRISGDFTLGGGTFNHGGGTLEFNGSGPQAVSGSGLLFNNLTIANTYGNTDEPPLPPDDAHDVEPDEPITVLGLLLVRDGQLTLPGGPTPEEGSLLNHITIEPDGVLKLAAGTYSTRTGNWLNQGLFLPNGGGLSGGDLFQIYVDDDFGASTSGFGYDHFDNFSDAIAAISVNGRVDVAAGTYDEASVALNKEIILSLNGNVTLSGSLAVSAGEVRMQSHPAAIGGNLTITGGEVLMQSEDATVGGDLSISGGRLELTTGTLDLKGSYQRTAGVVVTNGGTLRFSGASPQTLSGAGLVFANLVIANPTGVTAASNFQVAGQLTVANGDLELTAGATLQHVSISEAGSLTLPAGQTLFVSGGWDQSGAFNGGVGSRVQLNGVVGQTLSGSVSILNLRINKIAGLVTSSGSLSVTGLLEVTRGELRLPGGANVKDLTIGAQGVLDAAAGVLSLSGNWTNSGSFLHGNGEVIFSGSSEQLISGLDPFYDLTIANSGSTVSTQEALQVENELTVSAGMFLPACGSQFNDVIITGAGVLSAPAGGCALSVSGDWENSGTFEANAGEVIFNGIDQQFIRGSTSPSNFHGLTIANQGEPPSIQVEAQVAIEVHGLLHIQQGMLHLTVNSWAQDATLESGAILSVEADVTLTVEDKWINHGILAGSGAVVPGSVLTAYVDDDYHGPPDATPGWNVDRFASIQTALEHLKPGGELLIYAGDYSGDVLLNQVVNVIFDGQATLDGSLTIQQGSLTAPASSLSLSGDLILSGGSFSHNSGEVILNGATAQVLSGALEFFDLTIDDGHATELVTLTAGSPIVVQGTLSVLEGKFVPACGSQFGSVSIALGTVLEPAGGEGCSLDVSGDWSDASGFHPNGTRVVFSASAHNFTGSSQFAGLEVADGGALSLSPASQLAISGALQLNGSAALTAAPDSTLLLNGSGEQTLPTGLALGSLEIGADTIFNAPPALSLAGDLTNHGEFQAGSGTVTFSGSLPGMISGSPITFYNLIVAGSGSLSSENALDVLNDLSINGGTFRPAGGSSFHDLSISTGAGFAPQGDISVSGAWANSGTFTSGAHTVTFNGDQAQEISGENTFYHLVVENEAGLSASGSLHALGGLLLSKGTSTLQEDALLGDVSIGQGAALVPAAGSELTVSGSWSDPEGGFQANGGLVIFDASPDATHLFSGTTTFHDLRVASGDELELAENSSLGYTGTFTLLGTLDSAAHRPNSLRVSGGPAYQSLPENLTLHHLLVEPEARLVAPTTLTLTGDLNIQGAFSISPGETLVFAGSAPQSILSASELMFANLTVSSPLSLIHPLVVEGTLTLNDGAALTVMDGSHFHDVILNSGALLDPQALMFVTGDWQDNGGSFVKEGSTVIFASIMAQAVNGGTIFENVIFANFGDATITFDAPIGVTGLLDINAGRVELPAASSLHDVDLTGGGILALQGEESLTVSGDWAGGGLARFEPGENTVLFTGPPGPQFISGETAFHHLVVGANSSLVAAPGARLTLSGDLSLQDQASFTVQPDNTLILTGADAHLPNNLTLDHLIIAEGAALTAPNTLTLLSGLTNNGSFANNGGTVIFDGPDGFIDGNTPLAFHNLTASTTGNLTVTEGLSVAGALQVLEGSFLPQNASFHSVQIASGASLAPQTGATLIITGDWSDSGGFTAAQGVVVFSGSASQELNSQSRFYNLEILNPAGVDASGGSLGVDHGLSLNGGELLLPDGADLHNVSLTGGATLTAGGALSVSGDWIVVDGSFEPNGGATTFDGGAQVFSGASGFGDIVLGEGSTLTLAEGANLSLSGDLSGTGRLDALSNAPTTLTLNGSGEQSLPSGLELHHLVIAGGAEFSAPEELTLRGSLTAASATSFNAGEGRLTFTGPGEHAVNAPPAVNVTFNHLSLLEGSLKLPDGASVNDLTIAAGASLDPAGTLVVRGGWTNDGAFLSPGSTVIFTGAGPHPLGGASAYLFDGLVLQENADLDFSRPVTVTGSLELEAGSLNLPTGSRVHDLSLSAFAVLNQVDDLIVTGDWTNDGGAFNPAPGSTVIFAGQSGGQVMDGATTFINLTLDNPDGLVVNGAISVTGITTILQGTLSLYNQASFHHLNIASGASVILKEGSLVTITGILDNQGIFDLDGGALTGIPKILTVHVSALHDEDTPGWGVDRFASITPALGWVMDGGQVRVGAGTYVESVSLTRPLTVTLLAAVNLDGSLDLQDGRWELEPSASFSLTGDLGLNGGEYDFAGRPLILNGTAAQTLSGALNLSDLQVNNSGAEAVRAANPLVVESLELVDGTFIPACSSTFTHVEIASGARLELPQETGCEISLSGDWTQDGLFEAHGGAVIFDGLEAQAITGDSTYEKLVIRNESSGGVTVSGDLEVSDLLSVERGLFSPGDGAVFGSLSIGADGLLEPAPGANLTFSGDLNNLGSFTHNGGSVTLNGAAAQTLTGAFHFYDLNIEGSTDGLIVTATLPLRVDHALTITRGELHVPTGTVLHDVSLAPEGVLAPQAGEGGEEAQLEVSGDFTNNGEFRVNGSRVIFNGSEGQNLSGELAFHHLVIDNSAVPISEINAVTAFAPMHVSGDLTVARGRLTARAGTVVDGRVTIEVGAQFIFPESEIGEFIVNGEFINRGLFDPNNVLVSGAHFIMVLVSKDFDETTPGFGYDHFNDLRAALRQVFNGGMLIIEGGDFSGPVVVTKTVSIEVNGDTTLDGDLTLAGAQGQESAPFLTIHDGMELEIIGDLTLENGSLNTGMGVLSLTGDLTEAGGELIAADGGLVRLNGASAQTLTGDFDFYDLTVENTTSPPSDDQAVWATSPLGVRNSLRVLDGRFQPPACSDFHHVEIGEEGQLAPTGTDCGGAITVSGNWSQQGQFEAGGPVIFDGTAGQTISGAAHLDRLVVANSSAEGVNSAGPLIVDTQLSVTGRLSLGGVSDLSSVEILSEAELSIQSGGILYVSGSWEDQGSFIPNDGTVVFDGNEEPSISTENAFAALRFINSSGKPVTMSHPLVAETLDVAAGEVLLPSGSRLGAVTVLTGATLSLEPGGSLHIHGDWEILGIFIPNDGTVIFDGDEGQSLSGASTFHHLEFANSSANPVNVSSSLAASSLTVSAGEALLSSGSRLGDTTILTGATLALEGGSTLYVSGDWQVQGSFNPNNGTVIFDGVEGQSLSGASTFHNLEFANSSTNPVSVSGSLTASHLTVSAGEALLPSGSRLGDTAILTGATLALESGGTLYVSGDWQVQGSFVPNGGQVIFEGSSPQVLSGENTFAALTFSNPATITVTGPFTSTTRAHLSSGTLALVGVQVVFNDLFLDPGTVLDLSNGATVVILGEFINGGTIETHGEPVPPSGLRLSSHSLEENTPPGTVVADLSVIDLDESPGESYVFDLAPGPGDADNSSFTIVGGQLLGNGLFDYEARSEYSLRVRVTDGDGLSYAQAFTLSLLNVNEDPFFVAGEQVSVTFDEDNSPQAFALTLNAIDPDGDPLTWEILQQATYGTASLTGAPLDPVRQVHFNPLPDWNGSDSFKVRVSDGKGGQDQITVHLTARPRNDPPVAVRPPEILGQPYTGESLKATTGEWNDNKDKQPSSFSLSFQWQRAQSASGSGATNIPGAVSSEYIPTTADAGRWLRVRVTATDKGEGLPASASATASSSWIKISGRGPTDLMLSSQTILRNLPVNAVVARLFAADPDNPNETFTYALVGGDGSRDNGKFLIDGDLLRTRMAVDGSQADYRLRLKVTDSTGLSYQEAVRLRLVESEIMLSPGLTGLIEMETESAIFTSTLEIPAGAVLEDTILAFAPLSGPSAMPEGQLFAGNAFDLTAYRGGQALPDFSFQKPLILTIRYNPALVHPLDPKSLWLGVQNNAAGGWAKAACGKITHDLKNSTLRIPICRTGLFAMFAQKKPIIYLPLVNGVEAVEEPIEEPIDEPIEEPIEEPIKKPGRDD